MEDFEHIRVQVPDGDRIVQAGSVQRPSATENEEPRAEEPGGTAFEASMAQDGEETRDDDVEAIDGIEPMPTIQRAVIIACIVLILGAIIYGIGFMG